VSGGGRGGAGEEAGRQGGGVEGEPPSVNLWLESQLAPPPLSLLLLSVVQVILG